MAEDERAIPTAEEFSAGLRELEDLKRQAEAFQIRHEAGTDLVAVDQSAESRQEVMLATKVEIEKLSMRLKSQTTAMEKALKAQIEEADRAMQPLKAEMARLTEGIEVLEGYLGVGENISTIRDGEPAPADATIWVRQMVLGMDEECAVTEDGGITARSIAQFTGWLTADQAHLDQVAPEEKCVVALRPRRRPRDYGDPYVNRQRQLEDAYTYLLIRNGEILYLYAAGKSIAEELLVPDPAQFDEMFTERVFNDRLGDWEKVQMKPGTPQWAGAEEAADERRKSFMGAALVLEGLLHRTAVFHPIPEGASFVQPLSYDAGYTGVIMDAVKALGHGLETWPEYQARLAGELRPGMRVLVSPPYRDWEHRKWFGDGYYVHPTTESTPSGGPFLIEDRKTDGNLVIRWDRGEAYRDKGSWDADGFWQPPGYFQPKNRASMTFDPTQEWVIPFDLVEPADIDRFLRSRLERGHYLDMFPILKTARDLKLQEQADEEPFRLMVTGLLAQRNGCPMAEAKADLDDLVEWFKTRRRDFRPLVYTEGDTDSVTARAGVVEELVAEHARRLADRARPIRQDLVDTLAAEPGVLVVARKRDGKYVTLKPTDGSAVYLTQTEYGARGAQSGEVREWLMGGKRTHQWQILYRSEAWDTWPMYASPSSNPTGPQIAAAAEWLEEWGMTDHRDQYGAPAAITFNPASNRFECWRHEHHDYAHHGEPGREKSTAHSDVFRWSSKPDGGIELRQARYEGGGSRSNWFRAWAETTDYMGRPFENPRIMIGEHAKAIAVADAWDAGFRLRVAEAKAELNRRWALIRRYQEPVEEAWLAAREEQMFQRFLEKYQDASLWDGHRKSLRDPVYPADQLRDVIDAVQEADDFSLLDGNTVGDVADACGVTVTDTVLRDLVFPILTGEEADDE